MNEQNDILEHYLSTKLLGDYAMAEVEGELEQDGKVAPCFSDSLLYMSKDSALVTRHMEALGRNFHIHSVFPAGPVATPTDKLLRLIDGRE